MVFAHDDRSAYQVVFFTYEFIRRLLIMSEAHLRGGTYAIDLRAVYAYHDRSRNEPMLNSAAVHFHMYCVSGTSDRGEQEGGET